MDLPDFKKAAEHAVRDIRNISDQVSLGSKPVYGAMCPHHMDEKGNKLEWHGIDYPDYEKYGWEYYKSLAEGINVFGIKVLLLVFKRLPKDFILPSGLTIPKDSFDDKAEYSSFLGLVMGFGPDAFTDPSYFPHGNPCKLGDWVAFARYDCFQHKHKGADFVHVNDSRIVCGFDNPWLVGK